MNCLTSCLKLLVRLVMEDTVSPSQGWGIVITCLNSIFVGESPSVAFIFCRCMLLFGCSFAVVSELFSVASAFHGTEMMADPDVEDLVAIYLKILESILQNLPNDVSERQNLCHLFSSLSKLEGNPEGLKRIRHSVWEKMAAFSDDMALPSQVRVYALELMQAAIGDPIKTSSVEFLPIVPWEEWDLSYDTGKSRATQSILGPSDSCGASSGFTTTLVALRSTQILSAVSPGLEVTPNDLLDADSAASIFVKLCGASDMESHLDALVSVLAEWEGLFVVRKADLQHPEAPDPTSDWGNDDWNEGWESFQEAESSENESKGDSLSLHPLHPCWSELFKRFLARSQFEDVLRLLDRYSSRPSSLLLDEGSASSLSDSLVGPDIFMALKMVILLPYKELQLRCLDAAEDKLKGGGITDEIGKDSDILVLLLHSGLISTIMTQASYDAVFSYISFLVGYLARRCQESCLSRSMGRGESASQDDRSLLLLFERLVLPSYVSHLVKANQQMLAAFIITKFMHTDPSLSLINVAESSLRTYLQGQLRLLQGGDLDVASVSSGQILRNTVSRMWEKLGDLIQNALSLMPADVR
ncbi:hypothetical protein MLD38_015713 [Melastoma candidum]|nr:hypothetical protein MLD38_015713 [Melastoma candidum]